MIAQSTKTTNTINSSIIISMKKKKFKAPTIKLTRAGVLFLLLLLVGGWTLFAAMASLAHRNGDEPPPKRRILFVHVGKTGGETLKAQLQVSCKTRKNPTIRSACQERFQNAAAAAAATTTTTSLVSEQTVGYFHITTLYPRNAIPLATDFLFTLRNPISRVVSWYAYNHPKSCDRARDDLSPSCQLQDKKRGSTWGQGFFQCFDTMNSFAVATRGMGAAHQNQNGTISMPPKTMLDESRSECQALAWRALIGDAPEKELNHLLWNHRVRTVIHTCTKRRR
jgi:Sulfotransferase family